MTRTEKYKKYREEIKHSFFVEKEKTNKELTSDYVEEILTKEGRNTEQLSVDEIIKAHQLYDQEHEVESKKKLNSIKKKQILFVIISAVVILGLLTGLIIVGIKLFGGN